MTQNPPFPQQPGQPYGQPQHGQQQPPQFGQQQSGQQQFGQPQYGQQPPVAMGTVDLTIQGSVMTSSMITPTILINGHQVNAQYGSQQIPVPAGPVHVEASAQWLRTYGQAALDFQLAPGQTVPVFYAAPMHQFSDGAMGHQKQPRKGVGSFVAIMAVALALIVVLSVLQITG